MDNISLTKEVRIYNGKKTTSLTSGAGKTGVRKLIWTTWKKWTNS